MHRLLTIKFLGNTSLQIKLEKTMYLFYHFVYLKILHSSTTVCGWLVYHCLSLMRDTDFDNDQEELLREYHLREVVTANQIEIHRMDCKGV